MRKCLFVTIIPLFSLLFIAGFTAAGLVATASQNTTFIVNSTADAPDFTINGVCETMPGNGLCTLRAAIQEANASASADVITFVDQPGSPDVYTLTIPGQGEDAAATGDLDVTGDLDILGLGETETIIEAGPTMGAGIDRVFHIIAPVRVRFEHLTIRHGTIAGNGGGILNDNAAMVTIAHSTISRNTASHGGALINNGGVMTITHSTLTGNTAGNQGGGIFNTGFGVLHLTDSTVDDNDATGNNGGGIFNEDGSLILTRSTISRNTAVADGAGLLNGGDVRLINSTFSQNVALGSGGGLFNTASPTGDVALINSTFAVNQAASGGGVYNDSGSIEFVNTLMALNTLGGDCFNVSGSLISLDHNLDSDNTCNLSQPNDIPNGNANLGLLQNNGGPTETHALVAGSEAINAGDNATCPATDQRGVTRPQGVACDIGAFELVYNSFLPFIVSGSE